MKIVLLYEQQVGPIKIIFAVFNFNGMQKEFSDQTKYEKK